MLGDVGGKRETCGLGAGVGSWDGGGVGLLWAVVRSAISRSRLRSWNVLNIGGWYVVGWEGAGIALTLGRGARGAGMGAGAYPPLTGGASGGWVFG